MQRHLCRKGNLYAEIFMPILLMFASFVLIQISNKAMAIASPHLIFPIAPYHITPGQTLTVQAQSNVNNCDVYFKLELGNSSTNTWITIPEAYEPFRLEPSVHANSASSHPSVYYQIPNCVLGDKFRITIYNLKWKKKSSEIIYTGFTTSPGRISIPQFSGTELKCSDDSWTGIIPKSLNYTIGQTPLSGIYTGIAHWKLFQAQTILATTQNGQAFSPHNIASYTPTQQLDGGFFTYSKGSIGCVDPNNTIPADGGAFFLRVPNIAQTLPVNYYGFLLNPSILPCSDKIDCSLKEVTYFNLPTIASLNSLNLNASLTLTDLKWYYLDPNGNEILNGKSAANANFTLNGVVHGSRKVCYSHLLNAVGDPVENTYKGVLTYQITIFNFVSNKFENVTCTTEIFTTVSPVNAPIDLSALGQAGVADFNQLYEELDALPGVDPCAFLDFVTPVGPVLGKSNPSVVLDFCNAPKNYKATTIVPEIVDSTGNITISGAWYQNHKLVCKGATLSLSNIQPNESYQYYICVNGIPVHVAEEIYTTKCPEAYHFNEYEKQYQEFKQLFPEAQVNFEFLHEKVGDNDFSREVLLYPNPTNDVFFISWKPENSDSLHIKVISITGQVIIDQQSINNLEKINLESYPSGTYLVYLTTNSNTKIEKIIKN